MLKALKKMFALPTRSKTKRLFMEELEPKIAPASTCVWAPVGGSTDFGDAGNWTINGTQGTGVFTPDNTYDLQFTSTGNSNCQVHTGTNVTCHSILMSTGFTSNLSFTASTFTATSASSLSGGSISLWDNAGVGATLSLTDSTWGGTKFLDDAITVKGTVNFAGNATISGGSSLTCSVNFEISGYTTFTNTVGVDFHDALLNFGSLTVDDGATLRLSGMGANLSFNHLTAHTTYIAGSLTLDDTLGTATFDGDMVINGPHGYATIKKGATLKVKSLQDDYGSIVELYAGGTINITGGSDSFVLDGGTLLVTHDIAGTTKATITGSVTSLSEGGIITLFSDVDHGLGTNPELDVSSLNVTDVTFNFYGNGTGMGGMFEFANSKIVDSGNFTVDGTDTFNYTYTGSTPGTVSLDLVSVTGTESGTAASGTYTTGWSGAWSGKTFQANH